MRKFRTACALLRVQSRDNFLPLYQFQLFRGKNLCNSAGAEIAIFDSNSQTRRKMISIAENELPSHERHVLSRVSLSRRRAVVFGVPQQLHVSVYYVLITHLHTFSRHFSYDSRFFFVLLCLMCTHSILANYSTKGRGIGIRVRQARIPVPSFRIAALDHLPCFD